MAVPGHEGPTPFLQAQEHLCYSHGLCNIINGHNVECLQEMEKRLKGTSLVTVSNHYSCTDDPALWGDTIQLLLYYSPSQRLLRHLGLYFLNTFFLTSTATC
ncbi:uncharacterized protein LOC135107538 isoform X3 [Scylla paramamosain]|uniref:uncharacterized protein LOC135107538 isoform X3 n=1 Tax=Scylla paramamosain TaxID=85552 RepID=UPI0030839839